MLILWLSAQAAAAPGAVAEEAGDPERAVCGEFREPFAFWLWSRLAGRPDPASASRFRNAEPASFRTDDGRLLKGYRLRSTGGRARGSMLVAQGNAMLADQLLDDLDLFARAGIEAWIFDYRGYGDSEGAGRLKAIIGDYRALSQHVRGVTPGPHFLYGISFGGVVLLNVAGSGAAFDRIVIDSAPARIAHLGCPEGFDPAAHFPADGFRVLVVAGARDTVVRPQHSRELVDLARARGGQAEVRANYAHPFMDRDHHMHLERLGLILSFLQGGFPDPTR